MNAPAYLAQDHIARAMRAEHKLDIARSELKSALAWVRHWQADVACGLKPTETSLARLEVNLDRTLKETA